MNPQQTSPNPVHVDSLIEEASISDDEIERRVAKLLRQDVFREKTKQIFNEQVDTVPFMQKVQGYADEQIDKRLFKNVKFVLGVLIGWAVSLAIAFVIGKYT